MRKFAIILAAFAIAVASGIAAILIRPEIIPGINICYLILFFLIILPAGLISSIVGGVLVSDEDFNSSDFIVRVGVINFLLILLPFRVVGCF